MAYVFCVPARVATLHHTLANEVSGSLAIDERIVTFRARGHIVKATNKHYRKVEWKPAVGMQVLFDGDLSGENLILDHIEPDLLPASPPPDARDIPSELTSMLSLVNGADGFCRTHRHRDGTRFRLAKSVSLQSGRASAEYLVHGCLGAKPAIWTRSKLGGQRGPVGWSDELSAEILKHFGFAPAQTDMTSGNTGSPQIAASSDPDFCPF